MDQLFDKVCPDGAGQVGGAVSINVQDKLIDALALVRGLLFQQGPEYGFQRNTGAVSGQGDRSLDGARHDQIFRGW